jgi:NAD(P)-dependent dehydrogenase (short-subunit alcohol dehydrogenase family)
MKFDAGEFTGQVALVTGAAGQGIGRAIAARLLAGGADVVVTDAHAGRVDKVTSDLAGEARDGQRVAGKVLDVTDFAQADAVADEVLRELGPVGILVNNAAYNVMVPIWDCRPEDWAHVMDVNLNGPWYLSKIFMKQMRDAGGGGVVLNISTVAPDSGAHGREAPYAVSKGGLNTLTRSCAHEGGPFDIRVNTITMGVVTGTRFSDVLHPDLISEAVKNAPLGRLPHATDIAEAAAFLASDRARCITGETLNVAAGSYMRY